MLKREIGRVAAAAPDPRSPQSRRLLQARTPLDIAACEVLEDEGLVLVYAVVPRRDLLRMLWGSEVDRKVWRREAERLMHGRWSD
jgi:hypothetical protein